MTNSFNEHIVDFFTFIEKCLVFMLLFENDLLEPDSLPKYCGKKQQH